MSAAASPYRAKWGPGHLPGSREESWMDQTPPGDPEDQLFLNPAWVAGESQAHHTYSRNSGFTTRDQGAKGEATWEASDTSHRAEGSAAPQVSHQRLHSVEGRLCVSQPS